MVAVGREEKSETYHIGAEFFSEVAFELSYTSARHHEIFVDKQVFKKEI